MSRKVCSTRRRKPLARAGGRGTTSSSLVTCSSSPARRRRSTASSRARVDRCQSSWRRLFDPLLLLPMVRTFCRGLRGTTRARRISRNWYQTRWSRFDNMCQPSAWNVRCSQWHGMWQGSRFACQWGPHVPWATSVSSVTGLSVVAPRAWSRVTHHSHCLRL